MCQINGKEMEAAHWFVMIKFTHYSDAADLWGSAGGHVAPAETSLNAQYGADSTDYFYNFVDLILNDITDVKICIGMSSC